MDLDFGTDEDGGDVGIDMTKLLSSSSQMGGAGGPNLSRQLMTHLRLLQADLQYLKACQAPFICLHKNSGLVPTNQRDSASLTDTLASLFPLPVSPGGGAEVQPADTDELRHGGGRL